MDESTGAPSARLSKLGWWWLGVLLASGLCGWILSWFDNATELAPDHLTILNFVFISACVLAVVSAIVLFRESRGPLGHRLMMSLIVAPIFSIFAVVFLMGEIATLVENATDFPSAKTRTFEGLLQISRAYHTHGKDQSWNIQTTPIWSNLDITETDYQFMLSHRSPDDHGTDPDEISSKGYFCAKATLQSAGDALRVLHAGSYALPKGTVGTCGDFLGKNPSLVVIG